MANLYNYNTSSAYKLDYDYPEKKNTHKEAEKEQKRQQESLKRAKMLREKRIKALIAVAAVFVMSFIIVNRYVEINEAQSAINKLQKEYNSIAASNQDLQAKIDKAVDLKKLQVVASEKFGMVRPERYQMFYIDLNQEDCTENVAEDKEGDEKEKVSVQGVPGTLISAMKLFK